uniref:Orcokinin-like n=1 Tax=Zophobas atratus TaxID=7074 RepID=A0A977SQ55_ZOPAT|nr:orcokinin-like [Zophobas atratus]
MWCTTPLFALLVTLVVIDAAPKLSDYETGHYPYPQVGAIMGRKPARTFGVLQLGGGYGVAKRLSPSKYETKTDKQRRGPLNGLIPGGAFGRAARSDCSRSRCRSFTYDKFIKYLRVPQEEKLHPYFSFDSAENRNDSDGGVKDGQEKMPISIDAYTPYQYRKLVESNKYI